MDRRPERGEMLASTRGLRWATALSRASVLGILLTIATPTAAQSRTEFLAGRLRSDDPRVRTQAALALGGTDDDAAVSPLCSAVNDDSELVRQAVAAALKRLNRATAVECLKSRLTVEKVAAVKLQLTRALEALDQSSSDAPMPDDAPKYVPNAKYYVAIAVVGNNSGRPQSEIDRLVLPAMRSKLESLGAFQVAPQKETADAARSTMAKRKMKGYFLSVSVDKFDYSDGNLRVRVTVAVFTYPGKDLRGNVPSGITQTGVRPGDRAAEENLVGMAAGRAIELFAQNFP